MKLSRFLPLVVGSAAGILASISPVHALTYNWNFDGLANTSGTFDESGGNITSWSGTVNGINIARLLSVGEINGNDNLFPLSFNGVGFVDANNLNWNISDFGHDGFFITDAVEEVTAGGNFTASPVPFNIAGGATIPTVGSLLALALMRKAKKRMAFKTTESTTSKVISLELTHESRKNEPRSRSVPKALTGDKVAKQLVS